MSGDEPDPTRTTILRETPPYPPLASPDGRSIAQPARPLTRAPRPWRIAIDWIVTIAGAIAIVLAIKAWVVNPYRIPSSLDGADAPLRAARARAARRGCSDRVLANRFIYHFRDPQRGEIVVFKHAAAGRRSSACGASGDLRQAADRAARRDRHGASRAGFVYIDGKKLNEPYIKPDRRATTRRRARGKCPAGPVLHAWATTAASSCDSRRWGSVPRKNLIGEVFATYWPPNRVSRPLKPGRPADRGPAGAWRIAIDWVVTIAVAIGLVLAIKAWVVNRTDPVGVDGADAPLRAAGCMAARRVLDRVLANRFIYFRDPHRGEIVVFEPARGEGGGGSGVFVKRLIGLPGDVVHEDERASS